MDITGLLRGCPLCPDVQPSRLTGRWKWSILRAFRSMVSQQAAANCFTEDHLHVPHHWSLVEKAQFFYTVVTRVCVCVCVCACVRACVRTCFSPRYNKRGWLGVKYQVSYSTTIIYRNSAPLCFRLCQKPETCDVCALFIGHAPFLWCFRAFFFYWPRAIL